MGMGCDCELEGWPKIASTSAEDMSFCTLSKLACVRLPAVAIGAAGVAGVVEVTVVVVFVVDCVSEASSDFGPHEVRIKPREKQSNVFISGMGPAGNSEFGPSFTA